MECIITCTMHNCRDFDELFFQHNLFIIDISDNVSGLQLTTCLLRHKRMPITLDHSDGYSIILELNLYFRGKLLAP